MKRVKIVSPSAELSVIRAMCCKNLKVSGAVLSTVDDSYFYEDLSKELYHYIKDRFSESASAPTIKSIIDDPEVSDEAKEYLKSSNQKIEDQDEALKAVNTLNKYRRTRILFNIAKEIGSRFDESKLNIDSLISDVASAVAQAQATKSNKDCFLHFGKNDNAKELLNDIIYGEDNDSIIPTGFKVFDDLSGGIDRGALFTIGAPSGCGKSTMAVQLAINISRLGYSVVLVPLEMSKKEISNRILANIGSIDLAKIRQKKLDEREKDLLAKRQRRFRKAVFNAGGRLTIFKPEEDLDVDEVYAAVAGLNCDVCIIDYISLLKGIDDENQWLRLGTIARKAKINAVALNRINVMLCQVSEEGKIRYAGAIKEHSDAAIIWTPSEEDKATGIYRIEQIKSRNSQPFPFSLKFIMNKMQIESVDNSVEQPMDSVNTSSDNVNLAADI